MSLQETQKKQNSNNSRRKRNYSELPSQSLHHPISSRRKQNFSVISLQSIEPVQTQIVDLIEDYDFNEIGSDDDAYSNLELSAPFDDSNTGI